MANDSNARSQRAKLQPRDKKGWWVDMGKKATWFSKSAGKMKVGTVIATDGVSAWVVPPLENPTHEPAPFRISLKALGMVPAKATIDRRNDKLKAKERAYNKAVADNIFNKSFSQEQKDNSLIFNGKVENHAEGIDGPNPNPNPNPNSNRDGNPDPKINKGNDGNPNTFETPEGTPNPSDNESPALEIDKEGNYNVNDTNENGIPADLEPLHNDLENAIKKQKPTIIKTQTSTGAPLETEVTFTEGKGGADNGSVNVVTRDENGTVVSSDTFNPTGDPKNQANQYVNDYKNTVDPQDSEEFLVNLDADADGVRDFEDSNVLIKPSSLDPEEFTPTESDLHRARPNETIIQGDTAFVKTDLMTPDDDEDGLWVSYSRQSDDSFVQDVDPKTGKPVLVTSTDLADETPFVRGNTESVRPQEGQDSLFDMPEDAPVEKEKKPRKKKEPVKQPQDQDPEQDALFPDESTQDTPEADPSKEQTEETPEDESYLFDPKDLEPLGDELVSKYDSLPQSTKDVVKKIADSEDERESAMEKLADPETSDEDRKELQDAVDFLDDFDDAVLDSLSPDAESTQDTPEADPSKEQTEETPEDESYLFDPKDLEPLGDELVSKYDSLPQSTKDVVKKIADSEDERESAMEKLADPETSDEDRKELQDAVDFLDDFDDAVLDSLSPDAESTQDTPEADPSKAVAGVKDLDKVIADTAVKNANPSTKSKEELKQENDNARAAQEKAAKARDERLPAEARQTPTKQEAFVDALDKLAPESVIQLSDKTMIFKNSDGSLRVVTNPATGALGVKSVSPQSLLKMLDLKGSPVRFADVTPLFEFQPLYGRGRIFKRDKPLGKITVHDLETPSAEPKDSKDPEEQKTPAPKTPATEGTEDAGTEDREVTPDTFVKDAEEREQEPAPTIPDNEPQGPKIPEARVARMSEVRGARSMAKFTTEELMDLAYDPSGTASKKRAIIKELQRRDPNFVATREMMYADIENIRNLKHDDGRVMQAGDVLWYVGGVLIDPEKADGDTQYALWDYSVNPKGRTISDVNPMFIAGFAANGNKARLVPVEDYTQWSLRRASDVKQDRLINPDASDVSPKDMSLASAIESDQLGTLVIPRKLHTPDGAQGVDVVIPDEETGRIATNRSLTPILSDGVDAAIGSAVRGVHRLIKDKNGKAYRREVEGFITGTPLNNGNVEVEYFDPITGETKKRFFSLQNLSSLDSTLKPNDPDSLAEDATGRLHTQDQFDALQKRMERNRAIPEFLDDDLQIDHTEPQDRKSSEDPTDTSDNTTEDTSEILGDVDKSSVPETGESSDSVDTSKPDDKPTGDSTDNESGEESGGESGEESVEETKKPSASKDRQKDSTPKERQYSRTRLGLPETREEEEEQIAKRTSQSKKEGLFNYYEAAEPYRNEFSRFASNLKKRTFPSDRAKTKFIMENAPVGFRISYPESGAYALKVSPNRWELKEGFGERTWRATTERRVRSLIASKGYDREETNMISPTKGQYEFNYQETMRMKPELANVPVGTKATIGSEQFTKSSETEWKDSSGESTPFADIDTSNESVVVDSIPVKDVLASTLGFSDEALNDAVLFGTNGETLRYNPDTKDWSAFGAEHFDEDGNPSGFSDSDVLDDDEASEWLASNIVSFDNPSDIVGTPDFSYRDEAYNSSIPAPESTDHDSILNNSADLPNGSTVEGSISQGGATRPFRAWKDQDGTWFAETQGDDGFFEYDSFPEYQNLADVFTDRPDDYGTPEEGSFTVSVPTQRVNLGLSDSFYPEVPMDRALTDQELDAMIELGHTPVDFSGASLRDVAGVFKDKFGSNPNISWVSDDGHRYAEGDNLPGLRNALGGIYQMYRKYPWLSRPASITALNGDDTDVYGSVTSPTYMRGGRDVNLNFSPHTTKTVGAGLEVEMNNSQTPNVDKHFSNVTDPKTYIPHHEMGHVIDGSRKGLSEEDASDQFHRWVADFLGYSLEALDKMNFKAVIGMLQRRAGAEGISRYSVSPKDQRKDTQGTLLNNTTDNINYPEVYAEAVADVEQNGANASAVSKYFFKKLVKDSHDRARYVLTKNESPTSLDKLDEFVDNESNGIPVNPLVAPADADPVVNTDTETKGK